VIVSESVLTCSNHPGTETALRCNRCDRPICARCAIQTPVGYRCAECVRGQQAIFDTAKGLDYVSAAAVGVLGVGLATYLLGFVGIWGLFLAPVVGGMLAGIIRVAVRRRRSRNLPVAALLGGALGVVLNVGYIFVSIWSALGDTAGTAFLTQHVVILIWPLAHGVLVAGALYFRLKVNRA
jgi:hypothetical protein